MTPTEALERVLDIATDNGRYSEPRGADVLREVLRRDWAVRVLDAWAGLPPQLIQTRCPFRVNREGLGFICESPSSSIESWGHGETENAARLAAAEAVWPELPESERALIGEKP